MKRLILSLLILGLCQSLCFSAAMTLAVTPAGAGDKSGENGSGVADWQNAMGEAEFETDVETATEAGDSYFLAGGTYNLGSSIATGRDGLVTAPILITGVKAATTAEPPTVTDWAYGTDRPLIVGGAWAFEFDNYWQIRNLRVTSTRSGSSAGMGCDAGCLMYNCKADNTSSGRGLDCDGIMISSEATSATGSGIVSSGLIINSYAHDSGICIQAGSTLTIASSVADTCTTGIGIAASNDVIVINNTIFNSTTGISGTSGFRHRILNNIIDTCTMGAEWTTETPINYFDYNAWGNNTDDVALVTQGENAITSASTYIASAGGGDFTVASGSGVLDVGLQFDTNIGVTGDYKVNIGVDQDDNTPAATGRRRMFIAGEKPTLWDIQKMWNIK